MKGLVFNALNTLVEEKFGLRLWDSVLKQVNPPNGGAYSGVQTYPDEQLFALVQALSEQTQTPVNSLIRVFGHYLFGVLIQRYPHFREEGQSLKDFLKSVEAAIHIEVKKLFPDSLTPRFDYEDPSPDKLVMIYSSPRQLCALAEGLFEGASSHFNEPLTVVQSHCTHKGDEDCRFELTFGPSDDTQS